MTTTYTADRTAHLVVDADNDFMSKGGKIERADQGDGGPSRGQGLLVGVYGSGAEVSRRDGMQEGAQVAGALGRSGSNPLR